MTPRDNALIGYAVLRANYNADAPNYLDNFTNFALEILVRAHPTTLTAHEISKRIHTSFGLVLPTFVVEKILQGARRKKLVGGDRSGYYPTDSAMKTAPSISQDMERYGRQQIELTSKLEAFIRANYPNHGELVTADLAAELAKYLEANSIPLLRQSLGGTTSAPTDQTAGFDYLISRFIADIADSDQLAFSYVEGAAKGAILAAVVDLDTSSFAQSLKSVAVYLDTPVLIDLLGFHGDISANAMRQFTQLAMHLGARVYVFEHSVRELEGVLHTAEGFLRGNRPSTTTPRTVLHFRDSGMSAADVAIAREKLSMMLSDKGVSIKEKPATYAQYGLDESELETALAQAIQYRNPGARRHDVDSISAIHRLREGRSSNKLEQCGYVMVTNNNELTRAAARFEGERHLWPLLMTEVALASLMWIRSSAVDADLPRSFLLATAYAGMQPDAHLWHKYLDEVDALEGRGEVDSKDALILRTTNAAQSALMEETLGIPDEVNAAEVLERLRDELAKPLREEVAAAAAREHSASQDAQRSREALREKEAAVTTLSEELAARAAGENEALREKEAAVTTLAEEHAMRAAADSRRDQAIRAIGEKRARLILGGSAILAAILIGGFAGVSAILNLDEVPPWLRISCSAAAILAAILAALALFAPKLLPGLAAPLTARLAERHVRKVKAAAALDS